LQDEPLDTPVDSASPDETVVETIIRDEVPEPVGLQVTAYQEAKLSFRSVDRDLAAASARSLERWTARVVDAESPVHISEAVRRICSESGVKRPGKLVQAALAEAIEKLVRSGEISRRGDFLWSIDMAQPPVRDRSGLSPASRKLEMVSDEEIAEAVCLVVGRSYGIARNQAPVQAAKLLGFSRATQAIKDRFDSVINDLLAEGRLEADGDLVVLGEATDS
jgi:hypothetical protein